jgi:hypothetical protein
MQSEMTEVTRLNHNAFWTSGFEREEKKSSGVVRKKRATIGRVR